MAPTAQHGATIAAPGTWHDAPDGAFILGIKEVLQEEITADNLALRHRHIYFAHVFKGQSHAPVTMRRFALGRGTLLDLEYLVDAQGQRVATFSYSAGFAGAIAAVRIWADKQSGRAAAPFALPCCYLSRQEFIDELRRQASTGRPSADRAGRRRERSVGTRGRRVVRRARHRDGPVGPGGNPGGRAVPGLADLRHRVQLRFPGATRSALPDPRRWSSARPHRTGCPSSRT